MTTTPSDTRTLPAVLRGHHARAALHGLLQPAARRLVLDATGLRKVDAYGGAVLRATVEHHLGAHPRNSVMIVEPADDEAWSLLSNLLGGALPARASWAGTRSPVRYYDVVLPAVPLRDAAEVELMVEGALLRALPALGYDDRVTRAVVEATAELADNALAHGPGERMVPPILSCSWDALGKDLQVVVLEVVPGAPDGKRGVVAVRDVVRRSREDFGSIATLVARPRGGLDVSMRLVHGSGAARFRTGAGWRYDQTAYVPGFVAGFEVHC